MAATLLVAALVTAASSASAEDPPCVRVDPSSGVCIIRAVPPKDEGPADPDDEPTSGGSSGPRVCHSWSEEIDCVSSLGTWSDSRSCYLQLADPQPPLDDPAWEGNTDGVVYRCMIPNPASPGAWWTTYVWFATAQPGPAPRELAEDAIAQMDLRAGQLGMNPPGDADRYSVVGFETWLWIADPDEHTVGPITRTATAGPVTVTATAVLDKVVWDMGDGKVTCDGADAPGTAWDPSRGDGESPSCGYVYRRSSAREPGETYAVTATSYWTITWAGGGQGGTIAMDFERTADVRVAEIQSLVTLDRG